MTPLLQREEDVEAAIATYLPDADIWVVGYDRIVGREAIRQNEEQAVNAPGFREWTTSVDAIRFIGADVAVVESSGAVFIGGNRIAERITWVVNRTVAGWRIAAVRIMAFERSGP
jgi:ketosteroid isomerase-like protein